MNKTAKNDLFLRPLIQFKGSFIIRGETGSGGCAGRNGSRSNAGHPRPLKSSWTACWDEDKWSSGAGNIHFYAEDITDAFSLEPHLRERVWFCQQFRALLCVYNSGYCIFTDFYVSFIKEK